MNKREAKRLACRRAWELLAMVDNGFLYDDEGTPDGNRKLAAWDELCEELARRGHVGESDGDDE